MASLLEKQVPNAGLGLMTSGSDLLSMFGVSTESLSAPLVPTSAASTKPPPPTPPTPPTPPLPPSLLDAPVSQSTKAAPLATVPTVVPPMQKKATPTPVPANRPSVGCSMGSNTKTVISTGNFEGDSTRLDVVMEGSRQIALDAMTRGNQVFYAFMGNCTPDVHKASNQSQSALDSFSKIVGFCEHGIPLSKTESVRPENVILLAGTREIAWLRLANPNSDSREVTRFDDLYAKEVLVRQGPLQHTGQTSPTTPKKHSKLNAYNAWIPKLFASVSDPDTIAVAMALKLVLMSTLTMRAAGLASIFASRLKHSGSDVDAPSLASLANFLDAFDLENGSVEEHVGRLIHDGGLTPEGVGVMPAAKVLVDEVLNFAQAIASQYTRHSKLVHCVVNGVSPTGANPGANAGGGGAANRLWLNPRGLDYKVGFLPSAVDASGTRVVWKRGPSERVEWSKALNKEFRHFVKDFLKGDNSAPFDVYKAFLALSLESAADAVPFASLGSSSTTCSGVTCDGSHPFGVIERRILVEGNVAASHSDLIKVLEQWSNINTESHTPSTYWSISTWCGRTKRDLMPQPLALDLQTSLQEHLHTVSYTLASLVAARVKEKSVQQYGIDGLDGVLGPVVVKNKQQMRVVSFTHPKMDAAFVVLLPEAFVRWSLDSYEHDVQHAVDPDAPLLATHGFLVLPDVAMVPLGFPGLPESEIESLRSELGNRVWALPRKLTHSSKQPTTALSAMEYSAIDAMKQLPSAHITVPGFSIFHTRQTSNESLAGVRVGLSPVPGMPNRMTISPDITEFHGNFRVTAKVIV